MYSGGQHCAFSPMLMPSFSSSKQRLCISMQVFEVLFSGIHFVAFEVFYGVVSFKTQTICKIVLLLAFLSELVFRILFPEVSLQQSALISSNIRSGCKAVYFHQVFNAVALIYVISSMLSPVIHLHALDPRKTSKFLKIRSYS